MTVNQISTLKDFQGLTHLRELYLRRNFIPASIKELRYLESVRSLRVLNLGENPISSDQGGIPHYRSVVLNLLPWLEKLDDIPVTQAEIQQAQQVDVNEIFHLMNMPPEMAG